MNANQRIKVVIGLGNPGTEYAHTYHNIGSWSLQYVKGVAVYQPQGYMNQSGVDLARWLKMNNLLPEDIIVVHDDSDLLLGTYKISAGGSSAGHNGVQSVIDNLGTADFRRLRIGIRSADEPVRKKALEFVLQRFPQEQEAVFIDVVKKAWQEIEPLL